jgi:hypothetical protein
LKKIFIGQNTQNTPAKIKHNAKTFSKAGLKMG